MSNDAHTPAPFGSWPSPLTAVSLTTDVVRLSEPAVDGEDTYWLEGRPQEGGRQVLVRRAADGTLTDVIPSTLPDGSTFDVRTRAHEYGGASYTVVPGGVVVSRAEDDRLYRVDRDGDGFAAPVPLTPADGRRYADLDVVPGYGLLVAVSEDHGAPGAQLTNPPAAIVAVPLDGSASDDGSLVTVLVEGPDFLTSPRVSPDGELLAWLSWDHPAMPWDGTELRVGELARGVHGLRVLERRTIAGGADVSVTEPLWTSTGELLHVDDRTGWWNLYRTELTGDTPRTRAVRPAEVELSTPQWGFGTRTYAMLDDELAVVTWSDAGHRRLGSVRVTNGQLEVWDGEWEPAGGVAATEGRVVVIAEHPTRPAALVEIDLGARREGDGVRVLRASANPTLAPDDVSVAEAVTWPSGDGVAHGFFYAPRSAAYTGEPGTLPPLVVMSHGGPTAATLPGFSPSVQYWTTRGIAVLDVNYGGSTGYGRAYRERLRGQWGIVDVRDCETGALWLAEQGRVDGRRLAIRGGSAGGFTTLAALTFTDTFAVGASLYGVGDLEALARETHKHESHYLDSLVGPYPERRDLYVERSPIHHTDRLSAPMILLQGTEDTVVPPNQAQTMADAVAARGLDVELILFEGERHGFRKAETIQRAFTVELAFYGKVLGFTPADDTASS
ncbi:S9 family peptidase [Sanguibacter hominis ATCC BAA-789]|uniref:S9 family peptidase n=1 Tax=Sanguibacter hominis ATCC BAA-789 TaxID=1312740 RepID=A0A9X5FJF9_9MICO|nr:S9 family peptidase [Sanguibacter hominis]NKX93233.1 S9 family peptidase [Sanguibacter hominis ATCC BAA-789]